MVALCVAVSLLNMVVCRFRITWRVQVGLDGLMIRGPFCARRFIANSEIVAAATLPSNEEVTLRLRGGRHIVLAPGLVLEGPVRRSAARASEFLQLVRSRLQAATESEFDAMRLVLEAPGESLSEWRARLRSALTSQYRAGAVGVADMEQVLEDPAVRVEQRVAAAIALVDAGAPDARYRIRLAARRCAHPKLRVMLEQVADEELSELEPALSKMVERREREA